MLWPHREHRIFASGFLPSALPGSDKIIVGIRIGPVDRRPPDTRRLCQETHRQDDALEGRCHRVATPHFRESVAGRARRLRGCINLAWRSPATPTAPNSVHTRRGRPASRLAVIGQAQDCVASVKPLRSFKPIPEHAVGIASRLPDRAFVGDRDALHVAPQGLSAPKGSDLHGATLRVGPFLESDDGAATHRMRERHHPLCRRFVHPSVDARLVGRI